MYRRETFSSKFHGDNWRTKICQPREEGKKNRIQHVIVDKAEESWNRDGLIFYTFNSIEMSKTLESLFSNIQVVGHGMESQ